MGNNTLTQINQSNQSNSILQKPNITSRLQPSSNILEKKVVEFFYLKQLKMDTQKLQPKHQNKTRKSSTQNSNKFNKITVSWNNFVKIKKKNYLEEYQDIQCIGKGGYGTVMKVKSKYGGGLKAAKIITKQFIKNQIGQQKLIAEVTIPNQLDHPNIIKFFQVFQQTDKYIIIMQLCEGGDLFNQIKKFQFLKEAKIGFYMNQILSSLAYLHSQGIVHRDLKPENILYDNQHCLLKLSDFGASSKIGKEKLSQVIGTPFYMAPQILKKQYDEKCDIWSCGVILYILLSGRPPFIGKDNQQIFYNIQNKNLEFNGKYTFYSGPIWQKRSELAKKLILTMLNKNPSQRISASQALTCQWFCKIPKKDSTIIINGAVQNMRRFSFSNKLNAVVYTYIASQSYQNKDKEQLMEVFKNLDKNNDGVIGIDELRQMRKSSKMEMNEQQLQRIISIVDTNGSGLIDFTQFLVAASKEEELTQINKLQSAFNYLDADHSGKISIQEVKTFLEQSCQTDQQIKNIFQTVDQNSDGQISKEQFIQLFSKKTYLLK